MSNTWVLVAESSRVKIFHLNTVTDALEEIADLTHAESRMHEHDLTTDLPGSQAGGGRGSHHHYDERSNVKQQEQLRFAKQVAEKLSRAWNNGEFSQLIVASPPAFLGTLRKAFSPNVTQSIVQEIDKNLIQFTANQIMDHLEIYQT